MTVCNVLASLLPATEFNPTLFVADVSFGVAGGESAFLNKTSNTLDINGLLTSGGLSTQPDPGVPYLYPPRAPSDATASHLPVTYDPSLGLYTWTTNDSSYKAITSSFHFLSFHFYTSGNSGVTKSIEIPFALLKLTLTYSIGDADTPYFRCRSYTPPSGSGDPAAIFGRAFLPSVRLAQNWATERVCLAQARSPSHATEDVTAIDAGSTTLAKLPTAGA